MGAVHFPEDRLTAYLRVFLPEDRIDAVLDAVAQAAIESDVSDEVELFTLAHWLMEADERRTPAVEAVVLVEEVGLSHAEAAIVLDLTREEVTDAVRAAWDEATASEAAAAEPAPEPEPEPALGPAPDPESESEPATEPGSAPAAGRWSVGRGQSAGPDRRRPGAGVVLFGVVILAVVVLGVAVLSAAGRARLSAQGLDPLVAIGVVIGLLAGGAALLRAAGDPGREDRSSDAADVSAAGPGDGRADP